MFGRWGNPDEQACRQMVDGALAAGVTLFDTADIYDFGTSEEIPRTCSWRAAATRWCWPPRSATR